jgi:hypothetical protein
MVPVPGLTSPALVYLLVGLLAVLLGSVMWAWPALARPGVRQVGRRIVALCAVQVIMVALTFVVVNDINGFYSSWADLFGRYRGGGALITLRGGTPRSTASISVLRARRVITSDGRPGGTLETVRIHGQLSGLAVVGHVYLPPGYPRSGPADPRYPVIVVISAAGDGTGSPYSPRHTAEAAAAQIAAGRLRPVIVLTLPPGPGRDPGCLDMPGGPQGAMFFAQDLPAAIGSRYRAGYQPGEWALLGDTSGGYCALQLALTSAPMFSAVAAPAAGHYRAAPRLAVLDHSSQLREQDNLLWLLSHQPMQPISVLFTRPGSARQFLALVREPMRAATMRLAAGPAPLAPVLDWLGQVLSRGSHV